MPKPRPFKDTILPPVPLSELPKMQALLNTPPPRKDEIERMLDAQRAKDDASASQARARKRKADVDARRQSLRNVKKRNGR